MAVSPHSKPGFNYSPRALTGSRLINFAAGLVLLLGLLLRLRQYSLNLSLWLDEAMLALNITGRSFAGLARPLDYDQGAPLGFLWIIKAAESLLGNHEFSLRLFPFLAGCLALLCFWWLARQLLQPLGALFSLLLFSVSAYVISYAAQVKQYGVDAAVSLLLYLLGMRLLRKEPAKWDVWLLGALGALAVWCSHPAVFTLAGLGLVLIFAAFRKNDRRLAVIYVLIALFWVLNFTALYLIQYRSLAANPYLTGFWADFFMPLSITAPAWTLDKLSGLFNIPGGITGWLPTLAMLILFLGGLVSLFLRERRWVWMFVISLVLTLAASALQKYPFGGRMGLFALPALLICAGEGLDVLVRVFGSRKLLGTAAALLLGGLLVYAPLTLAIDQALSPKMTENIAPTMAYLQANYHPGDGIYLYRMSIPAYRYYAPKYKLDTAPVLNGADLHLDRQGYAAEVKQLAGNKRVWFLFSHLTDPEYVQDRDAILASADQLGARKREFSQPGTLINLYLYDLAP